MGMFCYQCQETAKNEGCAVRGVCGKDARTANLQDLLVYTLKGVSFYAQQLNCRGEDVPADAASHVTEGLFSTITNVNFDPQYFAEQISAAVAVRDRLAEQYRAAGGDESRIPEAARWTPEEDADLQDEADGAGAFATEDENIRSLRELLTYGVKGMAAYLYHARVLGAKSTEIDRFITEALAATTDDSLTVDDLVNLNLRAGEMAVATMALLDAVNTETYGHPEPTRVSLEVRDRPGILVSGHDLKDLEELLKQTEGAGVDVYTHGEMLPAQAYPQFKQYDHFAGNYGNAWWKQNQEFAAFGGPILMTTNCLIPPRDNYKDRVYTTGPVRYPGMTNISEPAPGESKDFTEMIEHAKECPAPKPLEEGSLTVGFAHNAVLDVADDVVEAVKAGDIRRFIVMAGCDGRHKEREYYTEVARNLPDDAIILTAGCAKYRYNKLDLGDIGGIPRVLDAGQCNDSYSLVVIAQKLAEAFEVEDINELPISFDIAWYEQKAVAVLLALLHLGVKGIRLGPTLPAFVSPDVLQVLVENFDIKPSGEVTEDIEAMMAGR